MNIAKKSVNLTGRVFGRLTVVYKIEKSNSQKWHCICSCGREVDVCTHNLLKGVSKSCGCYQADLARAAHTTHGKSATKLHNVWWGMIQRCEYVNHIDRKWYSESGIEVCREWRNDFQKFYDWAVANGYKEGLSIDRIDNSKGYNPKNCRFVTPKDQANNRSTNILITYNNKTQTLKQWAEEYNIKYSTLYYRIKHGWSFERAIDIA